MVRTAKKEDEAEKCDNRYNSKQGSKESFRENMTLNKDLKEVREQLLWIPGKRVFQTKEKVSAKALRQGYTWNIIGKSCMSV